MKFLKGLSNDDVARLDNFQNDIRDLDIWGINVPTTVLLHSDAVSFEWKSEEPKANGCTYIEHAAKYVLRNGRWNGRVNLGD